MIVMPRGRRRSDPVPVPGASGKAPRSAAIGGHQDRTKAQHACFDDGVVGVLTFVPLGGQSEVDHNDGVLFHDADQQNDADDHDVPIDPAPTKRSTAE